jgi:hypothetical protein
MVILGPKHEARVEVEEGKPNNHNVKDKNNNPAQLMTSAEVAAMWANGNVKAVGLILEADVGSTCLVMQVGGSTYKICI